MLNVSVIKIIIKNVLLYLIDLQFGRQRPIDCLERFAKFGSSE